MEHLTRTPDLHGERLGVRTGLVQCRCSDMNEGGSESLGGTGLLARRTASFPVTKTTMPLSLVGWQSVVVGWC